MKNSSQKESKPHCSNNKSPTIISVPNKILLLNDIHLPFEDRSSIKIALELGKENQIKTIVLGGDLLDFFAISKFVSNPKERNLKQELSHSKDFLLNLRKSFPTARIIFKWGNHEKRWNQYLWTHAEQLSDLDELSLENILGLKQSKIEMVAEGNLIHCGNNFTICHGHETGLSGILGVYPARGLQLSSKTNSICGHCHRESSYISRDIRGNMIKNYSTGCLSDISPDFSRYNNWTRGCAIIELEKNHQFEVSLKSF
jgi:predicted phosphodiesterase